MNKQVKLYDGNVTIQFNENARNRYVIQETGVSPVGVTTVLSSLAKPALMLWPLNEALKHLRTNPTDLEGAAKAYLTKSDGGKDTGKTIHAAIEQFLDGKMPVVPPEAEKALKAFVKWYREQPRIRPLSLETIVYSKRFSVAGTYDAMLEIDGKVVLADWKTTNISRTAPLGVYSEMYLQLGAYSLAHHEEFPLEKIDDLMVVRVGKEGVVHTLRASEVGLTVQDCELGFTNLLRVYKMMTPLTKVLTELKEKK